MTIDPVGALRGVAGHPSQAGRQRVVPGVVPAWQPFRVREEQALFPGHLFEVGEQHVRQERWQVDHAAGLEGRCDAAT
jgi:hypothetical protein